MSGDRGRCGHRGTYEVGPAPFALPPFKITVGRRRAPFLGLKIIGVHGQAHAAAGKTPLTGKTDVSGFFEGTVDLKDFKNLEYDTQPEFFVTAEKNGDFAFVGSTWNNGMQPYDFDGVYQGFRGPDQATYEAWHNSTDRHRLFADQPHYLVREPTRRFNSLDPAPTEL